VKIRGTAHHIAEKYLQLARDAQSSGDPVAAENYYQHAEHYFRLIAAAQEQFRQSQPYYQPAEPREDPFEEGEEEPASSFGAEPGYPVREAQPFMREAQPYPPREPQPYPPREPQPGVTARPQPPTPPAEAQSDVDRLPSFITGAPQASSYAANGHEGTGHAPDRFPLHRRRRRHRGPRGEVGTAPVEDSAVRPPSSE
jgi:hypothetical protein